MLPMPVRGDDGRDNVQVLVSGEYEIVEIKSLSAKSDVCEFGLLQDYEGVTGVC